MNPRLCSKPALKRRIHSSHEATLAGSDDPALATILVLAVGGLFGTACTGSRRASRSPKA